MQKDVHAFEQPLLKGARCVARGCASSNLAFFLASTRWFRKSYRHFHLKHTDSLITL